MMLGAYCVYAETIPVLRGGTNAFDRLERMTDGDEAIGISGLSYKFILRDCDTALTGYGGVVMRLQDQAFQDRLPTLCADVARQVLASTPANGQAEFILAKVAAHNGDSAAFDGHLRASQALSPSEGHLAARRVILAEANIDDLSADGLARHQNDLLLLMRAGQNIWWVAQLYVADEAARQRITTALETLAPAEQARFLSAVRHQLDMQGRF